MLQRKTLSIATVIVLALLSMEFKCNETSYQKAGHLAKDFAASVLVTQQVEIQAYKTGYVDQNLHVSIQSELVQIADAGVRLDAAINQSHSAASAAAEVKVIEGLLADLSQSKLAGIKDLNTQTAVRAAILSCQTIIDSILAFGA